MSPIVIVDHLRRKFGKYEVQIISVIRLFIKVVQVEISINKGNLDLSISSHVFLSPLTAKFPVVLHVLIMRLHVKFFQYFPLD